mmetsp:Transcript_96813/g.144983  ORF Transcript_96813/g.144983 Transcript_96813/m.144983 type:complete len:1048 (-) Transcript_96813:15-3158(-)
MVAVTGSGVDPKRLASTEYDNNNKEIDEMMRLATVDEKETPSNSGKSKKKGLFSVFGKKKNGEKYNSDPPTAPSTPELLNVTVVDTEYDPSKSYDLVETKSDVSGLTDRDGMTSPGPRKVGFDMNDEELPPPRGAERNDAARSVDEGPGTTVESSTMAETKTINTENTEKQCGSDSFVHQTLAAFDDICNPAEPSDDANPNERRNWGTVPSEEEDDSTYYQSRSLQSTMEDSSVGRAFSVHTGTTTAHNNSVEVEEAQQKKKQKQLNMSPVQDHENFEVVLDTALLKGPPKRRSLFAFSKRDDASEEEKKEEAEPSASAAPEVRSPTRKSLVKRLFSTRKVKEELPVADNAAKAIPVALERKSPVLEDKPAEIEEEEEVELGAESEDLVSEPSDERSAHEESVEREISKETANAGSVPAVADDPLQDQENKEEKWNKMLSQLELAKQVEEDVKAMESTPAESFEIKTKPSEKRKKTVRSMSVGVLAKKLLKPMKSVRKRAKDDAAVKYNKPVKPPTPSPAPAPAPPAKAKKPKPVWKAVVDPNSGKTYYYHRKTRETTWTKPEELRKTEAEPSTPTPPTEQKPAPIEPTEGATEKSIPTEQKDSDDVVVSDDRFKTPPRRNTTEVWTAETVESPIVPPAIVKTEMKFGQQSLLDRTENEDNAAATMSSSKFDATWEKKKEIERLLTGLSPPDQASVDNLMKQYEGKEDVLLRQLRDKVESQPFDEPFLDEPASRAPAANAVPSPNKNFTRTTTYVSKASANTRSSTKTDKTEKIKNTFRGNKAIETISENQSTATSITSHHDDDYQNLPDRYQVPRERELMVEDLTSARVVAETFDGKGRVTRGPAADYSDREDGSYYGDNEVDTCTSDTVSALSENDGDFLSRKENFDQARRRALDDAIEREDWDLAAVLSEGMRAASSGVEPTKPSANKWTTNELDSLIADNDWDAVNTYIARKQSQKKASLKAIEEDIPIDTRSAGSNTNGSTTGGSQTTGSIVKAPSRPGDLTQDTSLTKRIGSRSQLQHRELVSESSWTSDSSYESSDSEYS